MENVNVFQIIMPKKAAKFSRKTYAVDYFRISQKFSGWKGQFSGENQHFWGQIDRIQHGMLYRQIVMALGGPFANPLREDLDVHHVVQADGAPLTPDSLTPPDSFLIVGSGRAGAAFFARICVREQTSKNFSVCPCEANSAVRSVSVPVPRTSPRCPITSPR